MKTNQETIAQAPIIAIKDDHIIINQQSYTDSVLLDHHWSITIPKVQSPEEWLTHSLRQPVAQIISWPNLKPAPKLLDQFWDAGMSVELLTLTSAIKQAKSLIGSNEEFQLLIFAKNYDNSG